MSFQDVKLKRTYAELILIASENRLFRASVPANEPGPRAIKAKPANIETANIRPWKRGFTASPHSLARESLVLVGPRFPRSRE